MSGEAEWVSTANVMFDRSPCFDSFQMPAIAKECVQPGSESKDISEFRFFAIQNIRPRARGNGGEEWSFEKQASQVPFQFGR